MDVGLPSHFHRLGRFTCLRLHESDECREHGNPVKRSLHEMTIFTIDKDNNITAFASGKKANSNPETERLPSGKELAKLARKWPASRLIEIWNSLPGVSPVRKFRAARLLSAVSGKPPRTLPQRQAHTRRVLRRSGSGRRRVQPRVQQRLWAVKRQSSSDC
jgi:hypothetical protein